MATPEQLEKALRNAHKAGDTAAAQRLAAELSKSRGPSHQEQVKSTFDEMPIWQKPIQALDDVLRIGSDAATFGGVDYLRTMLGTQPNIEAARQATSDAETRAGNAAIPAQVGGAMLPAMALPVVSAPASMGPVAGGMFNAAMAGLEGAGFGGLDALGHGQDVIEGQVKGGGMGILGHVGSKVMGKGLDAIFERTPKGDMSPRDLRIAKDRAYNAMEDEGVVFRPSAVDDLVDDINTGTKDAWPSVSPKAIGARERAERNLKSGGRGFQRNRSLSEIDLERQAIRQDVAGHPDRAESRQGQKMVQAIDDWLSRAEGDPSMITNRSGDPAAAMDELLEARKLNSRVEKLDMLDERLGKARRQAERNLYSGEDSTIKTNIGGIMDDPRKRAQFTPDELAQMEIVNKGTGTEQVLRQAGRMSPGGGLAWPAAVTAGAVGSTMGPAGVGLAAAPTVVGMLSKHLSARATRKEAEKLLDMVASGKSLKKTPHLNSKSQRELARVLMMLGITSSDD